MTDQLDTRFRYGFQDKNENWWRFVYDKVGDVVGWYVWKKSPGDTRFFCQGILEESLVIQRLEGSKPALTEDDFLDLEMWLTKGGLDQYQPNPDRFPQGEPEVWTPPNQENN